MHDACVEVYKPVACKCALLLDLREKEQTNSQASSWHQTLKDTTEGKCNSNINIYLSDSVIKQIVVHLHE